MNWADFNMGREEIDFILFEDYEKVIMRFAVTKPLSHIAYYRLMDRIKTKDLPLFINYDWPTREPWENGRDLKKEFLMRLRSGKDVCEPYYDYKD